MIIKCAFFEIKSHLYLIQVAYYLNNIKVGESTEIELIGENIGYASDFEIKD